MKSFLFVFLGGGVGSCLRYLISVLWRSYRHHACLPDTLFPWPTLVANVLGCLLIGYFYAHAPSWHLKPETTLLLTTGLCGGFTTFSTFSWESLHLLHNFQIYDIDFLLAFRMLKIYHNHLAYYYHY